MKKTLLLLFTFVSLQLFSQGLVTGTNTPQVLSNKIINSNCFTTSGWTVSSGSNFGQGNSVGTFTRPSGVSFPLQRGIVLSTGNIINIPGPKILPVNFGDGNNPSWNGDTDMNTALGESNFTNASSLEFLFTSQKTEFKLDYVFASEEYGQRQCNAISDVVVILLTDITTGITTNIAKTPSNQIITPLTIRNSTYNTTSGCSSQNANLFDTYYGGSNASTAPINMFGHTVSMTAQATIVAGNPYKVKIVIADRLDYQFDSAIFIKDFIPTYTPTSTILPSDISQCQGTPVNLTANVTGNPANYSYLWQKNGINVGSNQSYSLTDLTGTNTYRVIITPLFCDVNEGYLDEIIVEFVPPVTTPDPITLNRCIGDTSPYDLSQNNTIISSGLSYTPTITYHANIANANNGNSPLPLSYNGALTTIFVRISQPGSPCPPIVKQFNLGTIAGPTNLGSIPNPIELCSRSASILNQFLNVNPITSTFLNGQSSVTYGVSYHNSQIDANNNTGIIVPSNVGTIIVSTGIVYVRVFVKGSANCYTTSSFEAIIKPLQEADEQQPVVYCGTPGYILPTLTNGKYFTNAYDGLSLTSQLPEIPAGTLITIPSGHIGTYNHPTIYVSNLVSAANDCTQQWPLNITLIQPSTFTENSSTSCDKFTVPDLPYGDFWSDANGPNGTGTMYPAGSEITETTDLYYVFQSTINSLLNPECNVPAGPITVTIEKKPDLGPDRQNIFTCEPPFFLNTLPPLPPGANYYNNATGIGAPLSINDPIISSKDIYVYQADLLGTLNCPAVDYFRVVIGLDPMANISQCNYLLPEPEIGTYWDGQHLPDGTCNGCTQLFPGDYVEQSGTIYLYVAPPPGEVCASGQNQISFTVNVTQPLVDDIPNFITPNCGSFTLTAIANGKYYTESHLSGGTGGTEITLPYIVDTNQTIYVYNVNPGSGPVCEYEKSFEFVINPLPPLQVDYRLDVDLCSGDFTSGVLPFYTLDIPTDGNLYTLPNGGGNLLISPDDRKIEGPFPVDIYLYNIFPDTGCKSERVIRITYSETLVDTVPSEFPIEVGVTYTLQPLITPNAVYHDNYWNPTDPTDLQNPNPLIEPNIIPAGDYTMPDPTQDAYDTTLYIYNSSFDGVRPVCPVNKSFRVVLYRQPDIFSLRGPGVYEMPNVYICGDGGYVLPPLVGSQKYYKESHSNPGPYTEIPVGTSISEDMFVYIYEENNSIIPGSTFKLTDEERFFVDIFKIDSVSALFGCGSITLPNLNSGSYYHESDTSHINPITNLTIINNGTTIITEKLSIYGLSGFPSTECQSLETFVDISITPSPIINPITLYDADPLVIDRTYCDTDGTNDGILNIDLTQYNSTLLGTQTSSEFSVTYHASENEALTNANIITESLSDNPSLYAVVRNSNFADCSSVPLKIDFIVNKLPEPNPEDVNLCINNLTGLPISYVTLDAGVYGNYIYEWKDSTGSVVGNSNPFYTTNIQGDYTLTVTDADPTKGCVSELKTVSVIPSSIAITGYTVTQDFSDNQIITIIPDGYGDNYVYQLDGSLFQESNVFTNVPSGNHVIVIRDKNGCGDSNPINVLVLQYPKFFTPNSDGYNDYWNIYDLKELGDPSAKISIFDRQGKLIKQISPFGIGWDGMLNGNPLFADDYWFVVNYTREGISREFKSHFSIKR